MIFAFGGRVFSCNSQNPILGIPTMRDKNEPIEIKCLKCGHTQIIYLPDEDMPKCPDCNVRMVISELLDEGKSY